jgi:hypothetical protein
VVGACECCWSVQLFHGRVLRSGLVGRCCAGQAVCGGAWVAVNRPLKASWCDQLSGQMEDGASGSSGDAGGHDDQVAARRAGTRCGVKQTGQGAGGASEIVGDGRQRQPGRVRGERSRAGGLGLSL